MLAAHEAGFLLVQLRFAVLDFLFAGAQVGFAHIDIGLCAFKRLARGQAGGIEFLLPLQRLLGDLEVGAGALQSGSGLFEGGACAGDGGDVAPHGGFGRDRIDLEEELACLDAIAFFDGQLGNAPHGLGADVDGLLGIDLAGGRDDGFEVALLDRFEGDRGALITAPGESGACGAAGHENHEHNPEPFLAEH